MLRPFRTPAMKEKPPRAELPAEEPEANQDATEEAERHAAIRDRDRARVCVRFADGPGRGTVVPWRLGRVVPINHVGGSSLRQTGPKPARSGRHPHGILRAGGAICHEIPTLDSIGRWRGGGYGNPGGMLEERPELPRARQRLPGEGQCGCRRSGIPERGGQGRDVRAGAPQARRSLPAPGERGRRARRVGACRGPAPERRERTIESWRAAARRGQAGTGERKMAFRLGDHSSCSGSVA